MVNLVPVVDYQACLAFPPTFTQPGAHLVAKPCSHSNLMTSGCKRGTSSHLPVPAVDEVSGLPLYRGVDLALLLPAVALNLRPGEDVLDMNAGAADGTHTLALAQTLMPRRIVCAEEDRTSLEQVRICKRLSP